MESEAIETEELTYGETSLHFRHDNGLFGMLSYDPAEAVHTGYDAYRTYFQA